LPVETVSPIEVDNQHIIGFDVDIGGSNRLPVAIAAWVNNDLKTNSNSLKALFSINRILDPTQWSDPYTIVSKADDIGVNVNNSEDIIATSIAFNDISEPSGISANVFLSDLSVAREAPSPPIIPTPSPPKKITIQSLGVMPTDIILPNKQQYNIKRERDISYPRTFISNQFVGSTGFALDNAGQKTQLITGQDLHANTTQNSLNNWKREMQVTTTVPNPPIASQLQMSASKDPKCFINVPVGFMIWKHQPAFCVRPDIPIPATGDDPEFGCPGATLGHLTGRTRILRFVNGKWDLPILRKEYSAATCPFPPECPSAPFDSLANLFDDHSQQIATNNLGQVIASWSRSATFSDKRTIHYAFNSSQTDKNGNIQTNEWPNSQRVNSDFSVIEGTPKFAMRQNSLGGTFAFFFQRASSDPIEIHARHINTTRDPSTNDLLLTPEVTVATNLSEPDGLNAGIDDNGNSIILWRDTVNDSRFLFYSVYVADVGQWMAPQQIPLNHNAKRLFPPLSSDQDNPPRLKMHPNGNVVFLFIDSDNDGDDYHLYSTFNRLLPIHMNNVTAVLKEIPSQQEQVINRFPMQADIVRIINWKTVQGNNCGFTICKNNVDIASLSASQTTYCGHNSLPHDIYTVKITNAWCNKIAWQPLSSTLLPPSHELIGYNIYKDGERITGAESSFTNGTPDTTETEYIDCINPAEVHTYVVVGLVHIAAQNLYYETYPSTGKFSVAQNKQRTTCPT